MGLFDNKLYNFIALLFVSGIIVQIMNFIDIEFSPSYEESIEEPSLRILIDSDLDHFTVVSYFELSLKCLGDQQAYAFLNEVQKYVNWLRLSI